MRRQPYRHCSLRSRVGAVLFTLKCFSQFFYCSYTGFLFCFSMVLLLLSLSLCDLPSCSRCVRFREDVSFVVVAVAVVSSPLLVASSRSTAPRGGGEARRTRVEEDDSFFFLSPAVWRSELRCRNTTRGGEEREKKTLKRYCCPTSLSLSLTCYYGFPLIFFFLLLLLHHLCAICSFFPPLCSRRL